MDMVFVYGRRRNENVVGQRSGSAVCHAELALTAVETGSAGALLSGGRFHKIYLGEKMRLPVL